jgi:hypothetical protein
MKGLVIMLVLVLFLYGCIQSPSGQAVKEVPKKTVYTNEPPNTLNDVKKMNELLDAALAQTDPSLCRQVTYTRAALGCFRDVAIQAKDYSICDLISEVPGNSDTIIADCKKDVQSARSTS